VVFGMLATVIGWLWKHSSRLTASEVRIEALRAQQNSHEQTITTRLASIEAKLDRMIERELGH